jgi:2-polyprenyl-3-methyl-5-hydroxy-6-metoxy-1,4-benzoquinol methylase
MNERANRRFHAINSNLSEPHLGGHFNTTHTDKGALRYMRDRLGCQTLVDVGCGPGGQVKLARRLGYTAIGIDGDKELSKNNFSVLDDAVYHDYTIGKLELTEYKSFDVAWCVEFLEHVEEKYIKNYMDTLSKCKYVICTAAEPDEKGWHHVNCKSKEYWLEKFNGYGFDFDPDLTHELRTNSTMNIRMKKRKQFIKRRGWLFVNRNFNNEN